MPMVGHINGGYVIDVDFREGNEGYRQKFSVNSSSTS